MHSRCYPLVASSSVSTCGRKAAMSATVMAVCTHTREGDDDIMSLPIKKSVPSSPCLFERKTKKKTPQCVTPLLFLNCCSTTGCSKNTKNLLCFCFSWASTKSVSFFFLTSCTYYLYTTLDMADFVPRPSFGRFYLPPFARTFSRCCQFQLFICETLTRFYTVGCFYCELFDNNECHQGHSRRRVKG